MGHANFDASTAKIAKQGLLVPDARSMTASHLMLFFLSMAYFLAYFDRMLMAVVGEMVKGEFALTDGQLSLLTGASFIVIYGIFNVVSGWFVDRYSRKRIVIVALVVWSGVTMLCGMAQSYIQLAIARAGVGIGESPIVPAAMSAVRDMYPPQRRPMAVALFYTGGMVGILGCFVLGTWAATEFGWRAAFVLAGPPGLVLTLLIAFFGREPEREPSTPIVTSKGALSSSSYGLVLRNRPLMWLLIAGAPATATNLGIAAWLPNFFMRSHGLTVQEVGMYFGPALSAGMIFGMLLGGWIGNRIARHSVVGLIWMCAASMLVIIPLFMCIFWLPSLELALFATFVGTAMSVVYSPCFTVSWQTVCHSRAQGSAAGFSGLINSLIGGGLYVFVVGFLSDHWSSVGTDSLRYALTAATLVFCSISVVLFVYAARLVSTTKVRPGEV
ncbi:spinster family MFS transporter [Pseudomonas fluorescens]|uniref:Sialic acid transporter n=1 Tax=Pseudomonas fluorescens TaxID=294 RepID=A0A5E7C0H8_PSEFL|nr:MFS transporter [Pseudomonas fluorescens]VVN98038.1 Putative sialic acid transporter [Pseudomonas fluorescens]